MGRRESWGELGSWGELETLGERGSWGKLKGNQEKDNIRPGGGGALPSNRLMGMCCWMGSHFHCWIDYNGVAFSIELLEWGRIFQIRDLGVRVLWQVGSLCIKNI